MKFNFCYHLFCILFTLSLFLRAFFPLKQVSKNHASKKISFPANESENRSSKTRAFPYQRSVLMIIDALRSDFMFSPYTRMNMTQNILDSGHGLLFTAEAHPPTVTLPRIKAITTGSTPSFIDVVLNFGSPALEEDNIVTQMKMDGRRVIFFGDDTWLNLFPGHFVRSDGTTSFYVSDYTEVDQNVTRHLEAELSEPGTWDVMILHYLGLDHIGHLAGPSSPLVPPKLAEMDAVITQIYSAMKQWTEPSLLVVCGDHGMADQGGHGGASAGETSVPLLFLSPHINNNKGGKLAGSVSQLDLCPTLAVLLGLPVPQNNLGKVILETLEGSTLQEKVMVMQHNAAQAMAVLKSYVHDIEKESSYLLYGQARQNFREWMRVKDSVSSRQWEEDGERILDLYSESLTLLAEKVAQLATQYDVYAMSVSMLLLWMVLASLVLSHLGTKSTPPSLPWSSYTSHGLVAVSAAILSHITMCTCGAPSALMCQSSRESVVVQVVSLFVFVMNTLYLLSQWPSLSNLYFKIKSQLGSMTLLEGFVAMGTVIHTLTLLSSSLIEEEHQTFYFLTTSIHLMWSVQLFCMWRRKERGMDVSQPSQDGHQENMTHKGQQKVKGQCCVHQVSLTQTRSKSDYHSTQLRTTVPDSQQCKPLNVRDKHLVRHSVDDDDDDNDEEEEYERTQEGSRTELLFLSASCVAVMVILRTLRRWNQTGDKWLSVPDFGDWLILPENQEYLSLSVLAAMVVISATRGARLKRIQTMFVNLSLGATYMYKSASGVLFFPHNWLLSPRGVSEARASFVFIGLLLLVSVLPWDIFEWLKQDSEERVGEAVQVGGQGEVKELAKCDSSERNSNTREETGRRQIWVTLPDRLRGVTATILCFMCLVLRAHNIPLVAALSVIEQLMTRVLVHLRVPHTSLLIYCLWMGQAFFFFQGNSNSLSTADLTIGYTGLNEFIPLVTGTLLCLGTYAGIIFWIVTYLRIVSLVSLQGNSNHSNQRLPGQLQRSCNLLLLYRVLPLSVYTALVSTQRFHLFVWTVFSPKLLYEGALTLVTSSLAFLLFMFSSLAS